MTDRISPALTPEEWKSLSFERDDDPSPQEPSVSRHGVAALALDGQPFGFTREDVELLTVAAYVWRVATNGPTFDYGERMASLRDRIAALLPPETP